MLFHGQLVCDLYSCLIAHIVFCCCCCLIPILKFVAYWWGCYVLDVYNVALRYVTIISVSVCVCVSLSLLVSRFQLLITWEGGLAPRWTSHPLKDTLLRKTRERERTRPKECVRATERTPLCWCSSCLL